MGFTISNSTAIAILCVLLFGAFGLSFWPYLLLRWRVEELAQDALWGRPVALFLCALLGLWVTSLLLVFVMLALGGWGCLCLPLAGLLGWAIVFRRMRSEGKAYREFLATHPPPKLQYWIQDLFAALFVFGLVMSLAYGFRPRETLDTTNVFVYATYLMACHAFAFFAAMDACRRCKWPLHGLRRALLLAVTQICCSVPGAVIGAWVAWRVWHRALWKAHVALMGGATEQAGHNSQLE